MTDCSLTTESLHFAQSTGWRLSTLFGPRVAYSSSRINTHGPKQSQQYNQDSNAFDHAPWPMGWDGGGKDKVKRHVSVCGYYLRIWRRSPGFSHIPGRVKGYGAMQELVKSDRGKEEYKGFMP